MKKTYLIGFFATTIVSSLLGVGQLCTAQVKIDNNKQGAIKSEKFIKLLKEDPRRASVNTHCYEFEDFDKLVDTKAPKGYKPFYISHYGRHGARSDWGIQYYTDLIGILTTAKEEGILTKEGEALLKETQAVYDYTDGMNGKLTKKGLWEHEMLAERMYKRYTRVFKKESRNINAISSFVPRVLMSMTAFSYRLAQLDPKLNMTWDTGEKFFQYINNEATKDMDKRAKVQVDSLTNAHITDPSYTMNILFNDQAKAQRILDEANAKEKANPRENTNTEADNVTVIDGKYLERCIYETAKVAEPYEMNNNIYRFISFDAMYKWFDHYNMNLYLRQCNSVRYGMERAPRAKPLVDDIIWRADDAIKNGTPSVELRFGHDWATLGLAAYIGLEGIGDKLTIQEAQKTWFGAYNVCFAENIQMIFYKKGKNDPILVKFLFNEKETLLRNLKPVSGPYYDWETVKKNIKGYLR